MNRAGAAVLAICGTLGGHAAAAPCVGANGETPLPGATGVEVRHADVPSALFGGTWQQGILDGFAFHIHANGSAILGDAPAMARWRVDLTCDTAARRCDRVSSGDEPPGVAQVAARIEACLLGPPPAPPPAPVTAAPTPDIPANAAAPATSGKPATPAPPVIAQQSAEVPQAPLAAETPQDPPPSSDAEARRPSAAATPPEGDAPSAPETATDARASDAAERNEPVPSREPQSQPAGQRDRAQARNAPSAPRQEDASEQAPRREQQSGPQEQEQAQPEQAPAADSGTARQDALEQEPQRAQRAVQPAQARIEGAPARPDSTPATDRQPERQAERDQAAPQNPPASGRDRQRPGQETSRPADAPSESKAATVEPMQLLESGDAADTDASGDPAVEPDGTIRRPRPKPARAPAPAPLTEPPPASLPADRPSPARPQPDPPAAQAARPRRDRPSFLPAAEPRVARPAPSQPAPAAPLQPQPEPASPAPASLRTSCTLGASVALETGKLSSTLGCTVNYRNRLTFSASMIGYPLEGQKNSGDAEYTYALTWRMTKNLTLTYANYTAAFTGGRGLAGLGEGRLQLSGRLPPVSLPGTTRKLGCSAFASTAPRGTDNAGLSCGLPLGDKLSLRVTGYLYMPGDQRDSDPDYSYSLSWTVAPQVTLTWSNYANNRWFWNRSEQSEKFLRGGSLGLTYSFRF